ncbi:MAG: DUF4340 domain-containing protein [Verrucomicrobiota bacterium]
MKLRTTLLLFLLTAGLITYVLLHERRQPPRDLAGFLLFDLEGDILRDEAVSLEITPDEIGGIDVNSAGTQLAFRRSEDGTWEMARGVKDRASRESVKLLLDFVTKARILDTLDRDEVRSGKVKESTIGLDDSSAVEITYRRPGGARLVELKVGRTAPLGKAMYVQFPDVKTREDVYIVSPDLRDFLMQPPDEFRDRALAKYPAERIRKFAVKRGEGEIEISRESTNDADGTPWVISRPLPNARADQAVVKDFLNMITGAKLTGFAPTTGSGTALPAGQTLAEVTLWPDGAYDRKGITLTFFPDPDPASKEAICRDRERKVEFKVERELVDSIALADSPNTFRDRQLGNIDPAKVATLEVEVVNGDSVGIYRVGDRWAVRKKGAEEFQAASGDVVDKLIKALNAAEILEFTSDSLMDKALYGLDQPALTLTFATGKHASLKKLAPLTTDNSRILRFGIMPTGKVYANFAGEPFVYQVGPEVAGLVPRQLIRWRTLQLPGFGRMNLRALRQTLGAAPAVELKAEANSFTWTAQRAGETVTPLLNQPAAETLAARLGSLQATSWQGESDASLRALALAPIVIEAAYETPAEGTEVPKVNQVRLEFAPMSTEERAPLYYGRHSAVPGVFLIDAQSVRDLSAQLLKTAP